MTRRMVFFITCIILLLELAHSLKAKLKDLSVDGQLFVKCKAESEIGQFTGPLQVTIKAKTLESVFARGTWPSSGGFRTTGVARNGLVELGALCEDGDAYCIQYKQDVILDSQWAFNCNVNDAGLEKVDSMLVQVKGVHFHINYYLFAFLFSCSYKIRLLDLL